MSLDVTLMRPIWLFAVLLVAGAGLWLWNRRGGLGDWDKAADAHLIRAMAALGRVERGGARGPLLAALAVAGLCVLALSGPAVERRDTLSYRNLDGVLFVVDASASVTDEDTWPLMLTMGRFGLSALGTRPGGLIVYAGDAYMASEMTHDHLQLGQTFSLIGPDTVPNKGSRPLLALQMVAQRLTEAQVIAGDVVVFTDGTGFGPDTLAAVEAIAGQGARLSLVVPEQSLALQTQAQVGNGRLFTLDQTDDLNGWLGEDARQRLERQQFPLLFWADLGRYVLILALFPLLLLFRRETQ